MLDTFMDFIVISIDTPLLIILLHRAIQFAIILIKYTGIIFCTVSSITIIFLLHDSTIWNTQLWKGEAPILISKAITAILDMLFLILSLIVFSAWFILNGIINRMEEMNLI